MNITVSESAPLEVVVHEDGQPDITLTTTTIGTVVVSEAIGPKGEKGDPGDAGTDKNYVHDQGSADTTWTVEHNLDKYPAIQVVDSGGNLLYPQITHDSLEQATITFDYGFSGKAVCN